MSSTTDHRDLALPAHDEDKIEKSSEANTDSDVEKGGDETAEVPLYDWPPDDPEHPHNWNTALKLYISGLLTIITMVVSINSSIYGTTAEQTEPYFGISAEVNTLGTSLFLVVRPLRFLSTLKFGPY